MAKKLSSKAPTKKCPVCGEVVPSAAGKCSKGHKFPKKGKKEAGKQDKPQTSKTYTMQTSIGLIEDVKKLLGEMKPTQVEEMLNLSDKIGPVEFRAIAQHLGLIDADKKTSEE